MPNPIVHFEIPADDVARAQTFYQNVFGWKIKQMPMPAGGLEYYGVTTRKEGEAGINGAVTCAFGRTRAGDPAASRPTARIRPIHASVNTSEDPP